MQRREVLALESTEILLDFNNILAASIVVKAAALAVH
jgi:hypothetical protein